MTKYTVLLFLSIIFVNDTKVPLGRFACRRGYDHYNIELRKDSTFVQRNGSCTWAYIAKGKWKLHSDTLTLVPSKIYTNNGDGRKELVDTSSYLYDYFYKMNRYVIDADTLKLLVCLKTNEVKYVVKHKRLE